MYVESAPGETGFPEHLRTQSWQQRVSAGGSGPGGEMQVSGMGADAPTAPAAPPPMQMVTTTTHTTVSGHMPIIIGVFCLLGLGFVIYKATRD